MELPITFITSLLEIETGESVLCSHSHCSICVFTYVSSSVHIVMFGRRDAKMEEVHTVYLIALCLFWNKKVAATIMY